MDVRTASTAATWEDIDLQLSTVSFAEMLKFAMDFGLVPRLLTRSRLYTVQRGVTVVAVCTDGWPSCSVCPRVVATSQRPAPTSCCMMTSASA